jgi:hypothetical protein
MVQLQLCKARRAGRIAHPYQGVRRAKALVAVA